MGQKIALMYYLLFKMLLEWWNLTTSLKWGLRTKIYDILYPKVSFGKKNIGLYFMSLPNLASLHITTLGDIIGARRNFYSTSDSTIYSLCGLKFMNFLGLEFPQL